MTQHDMLFPKKKKKVLLKIQIRSKAGGEEKGHLVIPTTDNLALSLSLSFCLDTT